MKNNFKFTFFPRAGIKGLFVLMPILGVGWILGLFAVNKATVLFEYAFAIVNGFQVRRIINNFTTKHILDRLSAPRICIPIQRLSQHGDQ